MYMIFTNLPLKYLSSFHLAQFFLTLYNIPLDLSIHYFSTIFRNKHNMVRAIPTRMLYTLIIHLWIPPCDSSNGLRNLYYYITGRFFTSRALGNASACPSPPAPLGDLYQIVINNPCTHNQMIQPFGDIFSALHSKPCFFAFCI